MNIKRKASKIIPNDNEKAVAMVGGNQFDLILVAANRARELANGSTPKVLGDNGPVVTAVLEIEQGLYTKQDYLDSIHKKG